MKIPTLKTKLEANLKTYIVLSQMQDKNYPNAIVFDFCKIDKKIEKNVDYSLTRKYLDITAFQITYEIPKHNEFYDKIINIQVDLEATLYTAQQEALRIEKEKKAKPTQCEKQNNKTNT